MKERLKSWAVWLSVLGLIGMILNSAGVFRKIGIDMNIWDSIVTAIGTILVGFGILNNPTDREHF